MSVVEVTIDGRRADLRLRRPDVLNAMNWDVFEGLSVAADAVAAVDDIRVVVVSGEGRSFCSGIDTSALGEFHGSPADTIARAQAGFRKIAALPMPTIAKVHGHAYGAGLQLALACDVRVMADDASVGLLEARYSLVPDLGGTQRLPLLVGPGRAKKMIWLTERIDGHEADRIGLAELVVDADNLDGAVDQIVSGILAAPPRAAREVKRLVDLAMRTDLSHGMDEESLSQQKMFASQDFTEAITAFLEGRPASYANR
jgi:enoyl-CoA hydratase